MSCYGLITDAELFSQLLLGQGLAFPQGADGFTLYITHGRVLAFSISGVSIPQNKADGNLRCVEWAHFTLRAFVILPDIPGKNCRIVKFCGLDCSSLHTVLKCYQT